MSVAPLVDRFDHSDGFRLDAQRQAEEGAGLEVEGVVDLAIDTRVVGGVLDDHRLGVA